LYVTAIEKINQKAKEENTSRPDIASEKAEFIGRQDHKKSASHRLTLKGSENAFLSVVFSGCYFISALFLLLWEKVFEIYLFIRAVISTQAGGSVPRAAPRNLFLDAQKRFLLRRNDKIFLNTFLPKP
jgi:hypothetical protein